MLPNDLIFPNPLRLLGQKFDTGLNGGQFGAVLARAGVGKTAFLVQISLYALLCGQEVLHISLKDPVDKVTLWYKEVFNLIASEYNPSKAKRLWDSILSHRFIMTFRVEAFRVATLEERLNDLAAQHIFDPRMLIIDGLPFDDAPPDLLEALKAMARDRKLPVWFTVRTHRHEPPDAEGFPQQLNRVRDLFEVILELQPRKSAVQVTALKGGAADGPSDVMLDPTTMLVTASGHESVA
jgi:hypothetical protein